MLSPLQTEPALLAGLSAIAVLLVITWVVDLLDLRRKRASQPGYSKRKAYARTMLMLWTTAALCVAAWLGSGRDLATLGLSAGTGWRGLAGWIAALLASAYVIYTIYLAATSREARASIRQQFDTAKGMDLLRPQTRKEHRDFQFLSVTAGVTEEIIFRGFLIGALALVLPLWLAALVSVAAFLLAHIYQGAAGLGRIAPVTLVMTGIFLVSGTLWPAILLHCLVDAAAGGMIALVDHHEAADKAEPVPA